jgi:diphthamide biosynthesis protein 4
MTNPSSDSSTPDYYTILNLATRKLDPSLSPSEVKAAYKRALLQHHPDKTSTSTPTSNSTFTIDSIALAYKILSSPPLKSEYDLGLQIARPKDDDNDKVFRTGLDTVDLDDLTYDEGKDVWTRGCRCGDDHGFVVTEGELELNAEDGELIIGCRGCSLWLRVLFGVEES